MRPAAKAGLRNSGNIAKGGGRARGNARLMLSPRLPLGRLAVLRDFCVLARDRIPVARKGIARKAKRKR